MGTLKDVRREWGLWRPWMGLAPEGSRRSLRDVAEETRTWPKFYPSTRQQTGSKSFILRMRNVLMKYSPRYQLKKRLNLP